MVNWLRRLFKINNNIDLNNIKQAIIDYRLEGKNLMFKLGSKYELDIRVEEDYKKLIWKCNESIPRNGQLSKSWKYSFHGNECGFHSKTKQNVEVVLSNPPEFGHIDAWFLLSYMKSTDKYKNEAKEMDWQKLQKVINILYKNGEVEYIE